MRPACPLRERQERDAIVSMEYSAYKQFPHKGLYPEFKQAFQSLLDQACDQLDEHPFRTPLQFTELVLQRYEPGQHRIKLLRKLGWYPSSLNSQRSPHQFPQCFEHSKCGQLSSRLGSTEGSR